MTRAGDARDGAAQSAGAERALAALSQLVRDAAAGAGLEAVSPASAAAGAGAARVVAFEAATGRTRDAGELQGRADAVAHAVARAGGGRWALVAQDAFAFAAGLVGIWRAGAVAVLPPNAEAGTLARLRADGAGLLADRDEPLAAGAGLDLRRIGVSDARSGAAAAPHGDAPVLELYTSGTAGTSKPTPKSLRQLGTEIAELERAFGAELAGASEPVRVFGTAAPQHLYGLLFRVLWPLCAGRPFASDTLLHAEELVPRLAAAADCVLVGTPAHLRRLCLHPGLAALRGRLHAVYASGGPLDADTAAAFAAALGRVPWEIYGSTETGGIALRRQEPVAAEAGADVPWTPFPPVRVERDAASGCARVFSPYLPPGLETGGLVIEDRVTLLGDGRFRLAGRADRVVKVGEKRLALPEMEERLLAHPLVSDAAVAVVGRGAAPRVAAAIVPSAAGREAAAGEGRRALARILATHLARDFDRVLLPRAWRVVEEIPVDERGKRTGEALAALFAQGAGARTLDPELEGERREGDRLERWLRVPEDLAYFEGHFPGSPVVPGVVQVRWALAAAETLLGTAAAPARLDAVKFKEMLRPGDAFRILVSLERGGPGERVGFAFEVTREERIVSSGRGVLAAGANASSPGPDPEGPA